VKQTSSCCTAVAAATTSF